MPARIGLILTFVVWLASPAWSDTVITACGDITQSGSYVLNSDLSGQNGCLNIHDVSNVTLNCNSHTFAVPVNGPVVVALTNVSNVTVNSCVITGGGSNGVPAMTISNSNHVTLTNNQINGWTHVENLNGGAMTNNLFQNAAIGYDQIGSSNVVITGNHCLGPSTEGSYGISLEAGANNTVSQNTIDGKWDGKPADAETQGYDDGIILDSETGDQITNNTIQNVWDCGIETSDLITNTTITGNHITTSLTTAIGSFYSTSWSGNTVSNNTADNVTQLFEFGFSLGGVPFAPPAYFQNNLFQNNQLNSLSNPALYASRFDFNSATSIHPAGSFIFKNNTFAGNNFGTSQYAPLLTPAALTSSIIDGGGNTCGVSAISPYPLACAGLTAEIVSPVNGAIVQGQIPIQINATALKDVSKVDLLIDGLLRTSFATSPYTYTWNTVGIPDGQHALTVTVHDTAGATLNTGGYVTVANTQNPAPSLSSVNPNTAQAGDPGFTLFLKGLNLSNQSTVLWNGATRPTTYMDPFTISAAISASDIANAGSATIAINTPAPGGGTSASVPFTISPPPPPASPTLFWPINGMEYGPSTTQVVLISSPMSPSGSYNIRVQDLTDGSQGPANLNTCGVSGLWVCENDVVPASPTRPISLTVPVQAGHTYSWWVNACTGPGTGNCSAAPSGTFTVRSSNLTVNTLSYFPATDNVVTDGNGNPSRYIRVSGKNEAYHTLLDPNDFEVLTWDAQYLYVYEDHGQLPVRLVDPSGTPAGEIVTPSPATVEPFLQLQMNLGQPMPTTGGISFFNPTADQTDCTPAATAPIPWSNTITIEGHIPSMNLGGDLGVQDVVVVRNDWGPAFERSYYALGWGLVRFESYLAADLVPSVAADTYNLNGALHNAPGYLPGAACTETHHAAILSTNVPATMVAGQAYAVSVTVQNTGTRTWTPQLQYGLGATDGGATWGAPAHVWLDAGDAIGPNQTKTFSWTVTAPSTPGSYNFNWQMVQTQWFGSMTTNVVSVIANPNAPYQNIRSVVYFQPRFDDVTSELLSVDLANIKNTGFNTIYMNLSWNAFETQTNPPTYNAQAFQDLLGTLSLLQQNGMKAILVLNPNVPPAGINSIYTWLTDPGGYPAFQTYVQYFLAQIQPYANSVYIEVLTENALPYTSIQSDPTGSAAIIRSTLGNLPNQLPSALRNQFKFGYHDNTLINLGWITQLSDSPIATPNPFDYIAMVAYPVLSGYQFPVATGQTVPDVGTYGTELDLRVSRFRALYPTTPLTIGEMGYPSCSTMGGESEQDQADTTLVSYALAHQLGFSLWSWPPDMDNMSVQNPCSEFSYGLLRPDNSFKPAVPDLTSLLGPALPPAVIPTGPPLADDSQFVSAVIPPVMATGQTATLSYTFKNTGTHAWQQGDFASGLLYRLGATIPGDDSVWGIHRADLAVGQTIAPSQTATFIFQVTAPTTPGTYYVQWRMVREGVAWFGAYPPFATVSVVQNLPPVVSAGSDQTITLPNYGVLQGTATDDGLPYKVLSTTWSVISGPGPVIFSSTYTAVTNAYFSQPGTYGLQLAATDGSLVTTSSATITVNPVLVPTLTLTKTASVTTAQTGNTITFTIQYQNTGQGSAVNAVISDPVPVGTTLVTGSISNGGTVVNNLISWNLGTVASGAAGSVTFQVQVNP